MLAVKYEKLKEIFWMVYWRPSDSSKQCHETEDLTVMNSFRMLRARTILGRWGRGSAR